MNRARNVAVGVGLGYLLGRRRKLRAALMMTAAAATGHLGSGPLRRMMGAGGPANASGSSGGQGRSALTKPMEMLAERLNERAEALRQGGRSGGQGGAS